MSSSCPKPIESCKNLIAKEPYSSYREIILYNLSTGSVFILIMLPVLIYILYRIIMLFNEYMSSVYKKYTKFLEAKGVYRDSISTSAAADNETYSDPLKANIDKTYYDNTSYDSITNEINKNIKYHTDISKERIEKNATFLKSLGYEEELDTIDESAFLKEHDNWTTTIPETTTTTSTTT